MSCRAKVKVLTIIEWGGDVWKDTNSRQGSFTSPFLDLLSKSAFFCDEMVICLARWIRAAGYKAFTLPSGTQDQEIAEYVLKNNLFLLTRDRVLSQRRDMRGRCLLLTSNDLQSWVSELNSSRLIDWSLNPMSRCCLCNGQIEELSPSHPIATPSWVRARFGEVFYCTDCLRVYWKGTHYWKVLDQLALWNLWREQIHIETRAKANVIG